MPDEHRLDRLLPYLSHFLGRSHLTLVRATALRALTQLVRMVVQVRQADVNVFPEYILPKLVDFVRPGAEQLCRLTYAECLAPIAECAKRFVEIAQQAAAKSDAEDADAQGQLTFFDAELQALRSTIQDEHMSPIVCDPSSDVKRAFLASRLDLLCIFLGPRRTTDALLSHMLTFLNDKRDWRLRAAFFDAIVHVAAYVGSRSLEEYIMPLIEKCLADAEEFVVARTLRSLERIMALGLFSDASLRRLLPHVAPLLLHPGCVVILSLPFVCLVSFQLTLLTHIRSSLSSVHPQHLGAF